MERKWLISTLKGDDSVVEKISVNIMVVGLNLEHNFLVPQEMCISDVVDLIVQALKDEYPKVKNMSLGKFSLMQITSGKILNPSCNFNQLGIVQGERLLLL